MAAEATAFWVAAPGQGALYRERLPAPGEDDVLVETRFSGISRGTEALVFAGRVPQGVAQAMRCPFQAGDFPAPVKYGYAAVGRVLQGPAALSGRWVFVLHPHQTRFVVPAEAAIAVPDTVPAERAVLAANMETALNGVWDAEVGAADRVCVLGAGVVGLLVAWLVARVPGVALTLVDPDPARAAVAAALGLPFQTDAAGLGDFDRVVHASGNPDGLRTALAIAGFEATVVELSWFGDQAVSLPLGEAFHARRLTIRSSQVGALPPSRRSRWTPRRRLETALALLADPRLDVLISGESWFDALPAVMPDLASGARPALCHRIRY